MLRIEWKVSLIIWEEGGNKEVSSMTETPIRIEYSRLVCERTISDGIHLSVFECAWLECDTF